MAFAIKAARSSPEKIATLRQELEGNAGSFPRAWAFTRHVKILYMQPTTSRPASDASNSALTQAGRDEAQAELATVGESAMAAAALAAVLATEDCYATWGEVEDWDRHNNVLAEMKERAQRLYGRIEGEVTAADLLIEDTGIPSFRAQNLGRVSFRVSGGAVGIYGDNAGERLIVHLLGQPDALKGLGIDV